MRSFFLSLLLSFSILSFSQVRKINAESTVQSVTVFTSGAQINRVANISVLPGRSEIAFNGLSNQLEQQSLQLKADANIVLLSVQTTKDFFGQRKTEQEEKELLETQASLKDKNNMDVKLLDVYKNEEAMLIKNQEIGGEGGVKSIELKENLDLQRQRLIEVYQKQLEVQKRIDAQQKDMMKLQAQLKEVSKKRDSVNYTVTALIESKETRNIKFQLSYTVKDAGWYSVYDIRVNDISQPLNVLMNANVFQRSGETWKDVELVLSTGNPGDNATPSVLQPWMLGFYDPSALWSPSIQIQPGETAGRIIAETGEPVMGATVMIKGTAMATQTDANGFFKLKNFPQGGVIVVSSVGFQSKEVAAKSGYVNIKLSAQSAHLEEVVVVGYSTLEGRVAGVDIGNSYKRKKDEIQTVAITTQYQPTAVTYKIEDKYSLETDGKTTTIGIKNFAVPALYDYYSAPKIDPSAFLTAKIIDWQNYDLQPGEVNLYFEGIFLGKTYIDLADSPDTLSISLGKDNNVRINRKLVKEYSSKKFIGTNQTESKQYEIAVRNTKKSSITIRIEDQIPVTVSKEIDVQDVSAAEAQINKETGIVTWNITLQPGEEKKLKLSYSIKYPKDKRVVLN
jgi:hypothetical protein